MKLAALILIMLISLSCLPADSDQEKVGEPIGDCRRIAEIKRVGSSVEVTVNDNLGEIENGQYFCDFAFTSIELEKAPKLNGLALKYLEREGRPTYTTAAAVDLTKFELSFDLNGNSYISDSSSIETRNEEGKVRVRVRMNKLSPK